MIDLQWNFPLLPGQDVLWQDRLQAAVTASVAGGLAELRPSFRGGDADLRQIAARWLGESPDRVWLTCGGHHGCMVSLLAAGLAGRRVAVEAVTYTAFLDQCELAGAEAVACAMDGEGLLPEALRELCEQAQVAARPIAAVMLMPTLHNPVGCVAGIARRREIVAVARQFDLRLIEDDAYGFLYPQPESTDQPRPSFPAIETYAQLAPERTFYVRGLSKSFAPAVRLGLLVAPEASAAAVQSALKVTSTGVSRVLAGAVCSMLADGTLDGVIALKRVEGAARQARARVLLGDLPVCAGPNAWHLWVSLPGGLDARTVQARCEEHGVLVSGGQNFAAAGTVPPRAVRLGLGGELDAARADEGVAIFANVVRGQ